MKYLEFPSNWSADDRRLAQLISAYLSRQHIVYSFTQEDFDRGNGISFQDWWKDTYRRIAFNKD